MTVRAEAEITLTRVDDGAPGQDGKLYYATCPTAAGTATKVCTITPAVNDFALEVGIQVIVNFSNSNTSSSVKLDVNSTGAVTVRYKGNALTSTTKAYMAANKPCGFVYDGTYWQLTGKYSDDNTYDRTRYNITLTATGAISAATLITLNSSGKVIKLGSGPFNLGAPILYVGTAYTSSALSQSNNYSCMGAAFSYATTMSGFSGTAGNEVYLVGTLSGETFTPDATFLTDVVPTTDNGKVYMLLGRLSTTTNGTLYAEHPLYMYKNGVFTRLDFAAQTTAAAAASAASSASNTAGQAYSIATSTNQYFWTSTGGGDNGAHITEVPQDTFTVSPAGGNLLANSNGVSVRDGLKELSTMTKDGFDAKTYDSSNNPVVIAHLGYDDGTNSGGGTSKAPYYTLGTRYAGSTYGNYSMGEGVNAISSGYASHCEGVLNTASGYASHAEGEHCTASGQDSHAQGAYCEATGIDSMATGSGTEANGDYSFSAGSYTKANGESQTVVGKYNVADTTSLFIVGKGIDSANRSNAFTISNTGEAAIGKPSGTFFVSNHTVVSSQSIAVNSYLDGALSITKAGYYPLAVSGWDSSTRATPLIRAYLSAQAVGSATLNWLVVNHGASTQTSTNTIYVLWVKCT